MKYPSTTREQMWAKQQISCYDVDYDAWAERRIALRQMAAVSPQCLFTVDVYKCRYDFASDRFADLLGYNLSWIRNIERQGNFLEDQIHPDDRDRMIELQIHHSRFIYNLAPEQRNDYSTHYQFRMRNSRGKYIRLVSHQQVIRQDRNGKAWMVLGSMDIAPDQSMETGVKCSVSHLKTGEIIPSALMGDAVATSAPVLTFREMDVFQLIQAGLRSKEIADRLNISIYTVHNHRKNILSKLGADSAIEAIRYAREKGIVT